MSTTLSSWPVHLLEELADEQKARLTSAPHILDTARSDLQTIIDVCLALIKSKDRYDESSEQLLQLMNATHARMRDAPSSSVLSLWRSIYTDACIVRALAFSLISDYLQAISTLDHAIIIAGPCGEGRLDLVLDMIGRFQASVTPAIPTTKPLSLPTLTSNPLSSTSDHPCTIPTPDPPSLMVFQKTYSHTPFILRNYASDWPAVTSWKSASYLRSISGPGRVVPVEIGRDYRLGDWKQELMSWDTLLSALDFEDQPASLSDSPSGDHAHADLYYYLAQHDLMKQFPSLRDDISLPDYLYASLTPPTDYPEYRPPGNDDQIILNTWLGPKNTMSPAHVDPYYNFYVQIVGQKTVWLAPPSVSEYMRPPPSTSQPDADTSHFPSSTLSNTSEVDVFAPEQASSDFVEHVEPAAMSAVLNPGDMLFFPPGWWHAMRSESTSFSLSMWF